MNISREVILDLLPVYLADEASPATRLLVEEYLRQDPELARTVHLQSTGGLDKLAPPSSTLPPDLELRSLERTRKMIGWQKRLYGFGIGFTAIALTSKITFRQGRIEEFRLLIRDFPFQFGTAAVLAVLCWTGYYLLRSRLRMDKPVTR